MKATNYGNGYKFTAIMNKRTNKQTVMVQRMTNKGTWGKATETKVFGNETPEDVVARLIKLNNRQYRLAE